MMKRIAALASLGLSLCLASRLALSATPEEAYLEARTAYLEKRSEEMQPALEQQLRAIVGPVNVEGFPQPGKLDAGGIYEGDFDFGGADGLTFRNQHENLFVTTRGLLKLHFGERDMAEMPRDSRFSEAAFATSAVVTRYADVPVMSPDGRSSAQAFLGVTAQDV